MRINPLFFFSFLFLSLPQSVLAMEGMHEHGGTFHAFRLETDYGNGRDGTVTQWDIRGWVGGDDNKLWLRSEGVSNEDNTEQTEFWALYSRNISTFWDAQVGLRYDAKPRSTSFIALGVNGLAPYFFETEMHLFLSENGDISARLREEKDFLITQQLILQPYAEINIYARNTPEQHAKAGLGEGKIGIQTRYDLTRQISPYIDIRYERTPTTFSSHMPKNDVIGAIGLRMML